jgi:hypothetical protein
VIPVDQRESNDCLRACIASIFEIPWEDAPDTGRPVREEELGRAASQHNVVNEWMKDRRLVAWTIEMQPEDRPVLRRGVRIERDGTRIPADYVWPYPMATHCIGGGESPRGYEKHHAVVMHLGKIVHDPHPDRDMTIDRISSLTVICARLS